MRSGPGAPLTYAGSARIDALDIGERDGGEDVVSWQALAIDEIDFRLGERLLELSVIRLDQPSARVFIAEDRSTNLGELLALLKDIDGVITVDIPVQGDVNDPEFSFGPAIRQALTDILQSIISSPFSLLASLVDGDPDPDELAKVAFSPGDIICHCNSKSEALRLKQELAERFNACGLKLHPEKTRIVYYKSSYFKQIHPQISFDFCSEMAPVHSESLPKTICTLAFVFDNGWIIRAV